MRGQRARKLQVKHTVLVWSLSKRIAGTFCHKITSIKIKVDADAEARVG
jgi:hypothetical protein